MSGQRRYCRSRSLLRGDSRWNVYGIWSILYFSCSGPQLGFTTSVVTSDNIDSIDDKSSDLSDLENIRVAIGISTIRPQAEMHEPALKVEY